jgi:hypothetical protein
MLTPYRTPAATPPEGWWRRVRRVDLAFVFLSQVLFFCLGWSLAPKDRTVTRVERVEHCVTLSRDERACVRLCASSAGVRKFSSNDVTLTRTCECR